ncbi:SDR family oxidoreductase [Taibaiella koreensis]|uniref:SDR family oxidoreductase n=1 Tax=Taibaiella koreensis TaxID=1268548 RepID=UPI000E59F97D|nr:SDR family NAD(P)-dependent oxidoreductase [Taibaiella koreensis]
MKTSGNTVLITGGSAGIGLEIARALIAQGNEVIITGRSEERLQQAAAQLGEVTTIVNDIAKEEAVQTLAQRMEKDFPALNIVINNAGHAYAYQLNDKAGAATKARAEMQTNYFSVLDLNEQLLPLLSRQPEAAIVNVSSIVAFVPGSNIPTYSDTKAALHSYSQALRFTLAKTTGIKVFDLMPPLVNTEFSKEIGGEHGIPPQDVATAFVEALANDAYEIRVGGTEQLYQLFHSDPQAAFAAMNADRIPA